MTNQELEALIELAKKYKLKSLAIGDIHIETTERTYTRKPPAPASEPPKKQRLPWYRTEPVPLTSPPDDE